MADRSNSRQWHTFLHSSRKVAWSNSAQPESDQVPGLYEATAGRLRLISGYGVSPFTVAGLAPVYQAQTDETTLHQFRIR